MKSAWACKGNMPIPEPRAAGRLEPTHERATLSRYNTTRSSASANRLHRIADIVAGWLMPRSVEDEASPAIGAREIEAWERHIRKFTEKHRFTGFPC